MSAAVCEARVEWGKRRSHLLSRRRDHFPTCIREGAAREAQTRRRIRDRRRSSNKKLRSDHAFVGGGRSLPPLEIFSLSLAVCRFSQTAAGTRISTLLLAEQLLGNMS